MTVEIDLQLFSTSEVGEEDIDVEEEAPQQETPQAEELTPEQEAARLRETIKQQSDEIATFRGVIEEIKNRPAERIIERERTVETPGLSQEDRERQAATLALKLGTDPESVLRDVKDQTKREILGEFGGVAGDSVIDRFVRKAVDENPLIGSQVERIFRKALDTIGEQAKAALVLMPEAKRREVLELHWKAAGGEYLMPKAKPKIKPTAATDYGNRSAGEVPNRREARLFKFADNERAALKAKGWDDKRINDREKAISSGLV